MKLHNRVLTNSSVRTLEQELAFDGYSKEEQFTHRANARLNDHDREHEARRAQRVKHLRERNQRHD